MESGNLPQAGGCCEGGACTPVDRRTFLRVAGASVAAVASPAAVCGAPPLDDGIRHFVEADKRLDPKWVAGLFERGARHVWRDRELNFIGMPVGGIAAGQVYLRGDGTLGDWKIFREFYSTGYGSTNYRPTMPERVLDQGFGLLVNGTAAGRQFFELNRATFPAVEFTGEYPIATVRYVSDACPVSVEMQAFSPFIPLNARDSAIPATIFQLRVKNDGPRDSRLAVLGWLENAVCHESRKAYRLEGQRWTTRDERSERTLIRHYAEASHSEEAAARPEIVVADFESDTYGEWTATGTAFGSGPAKGKFPAQQSLSGFQGERLVNTYANNDDLTGTLTSPEFVIERRHIHFLIGGGAHANQTCLNLLIDDRPARTATGKSRESLEWASWDVGELEGKKARIQIVDERKGAWGHINVDQITQSDKPRYGRVGTMEELDDFGTMCLALVGPRASLDETGTACAAIGERAESWRAAAASNFPFDSNLSGVLATPEIAVAPGASTTMTFVVSWHMPNRVNGQMYARWFRDAAAAADYVIENLPRLSEHTRLWRDTWYDSTLPVWLLDRLHSTIANLATGTCVWWNSGRFWAWEGVGCCEGTCTHVWNYAHGMARLFPELERRVREMQDLGAALHDDGLVGFRGTKNQAYAADGQAGTVLKCYREHLMSPDDEFLKRNWPRIRRVLEFSMSNDKDSDGLIETSQHNTYDINFEGTNTFVGGLFLAALRAGEEMAKIVGDPQFAAACRTRFESGSRASVEKLWNGEYFIQQVDLDKHKRDQYGDGCLADQLFGQGWAHHVGLGYLYPKEHVRQALESVWKYNWTTDVGPQNAEHKPERWFVTPGEGGLFICTWPKSAYLKDGVRYREEVWTGCEYQVAGHMVWEGMQREALVMVRALHDRYQPKLRNPFNEVECGDHYGRALASWGVFTALCGFEYDGPRGHIGYSPRVGDGTFKAAFVGAEGWGTWSQQPAPKQGTEMSLSIAWGRARVRSLGFDIDASRRVASSFARIGDKPIDCTARLEGNRVRLEFTQDVIVDAGKSLTYGVTF